MTLKRDVLLACGAIIGGLSIMAGGVIIGLDDVACAADGGPSNCAPYISSGEIGLAHDPGGPWRRSALPDDLAAEGYPDQLTVKSGKDVWAVQKPDNGRDLAGDKLVHGDGTHRREVPMPDIPVQEPEGEGEVRLQITGLTMSGGKVWAVGSLSSSWCCAAMNYHRTVVLHGDSRALRLLDLNLPGVEPVDVVPDGHGGVWVAAGAWRAPSLPRPIVLHYRSGEWYKVDLPRRMDGGHVELRRLVNEPGTAKVWAVLSVSHEEGSEGATFKAPPVR